MVLDVSHGHKARPLFPPGAVPPPISTSLAGPGSQEKGSCALPSLGTTAHVTIGEAHSADHLVRSWISTEALFISFLIVIVECIDTVSLRSPGWTLNTRLGLPGARITRSLRLALVLLFSDHRGHRLF